MRSQLRALLGVAVWLAACGPTEVVPSLAAARPPSATTAPAPSGTSPVGPLQIAPPASGSVELYALLELDIQSDLVVQNPYDPEELDLRVVFTSPTGTPVDVGAFWYQDFELPYITAKGEPGWKARFTPTEVGPWTAVARIPSRGLESNVITFDVVRSDRRGFVRVHPDNPRYFAFDNGDFFFPIGLNIAWWSGSGDALTDYRKWMSPFAANGGNTIRVWMADWSFAIEGTDTGLGDYDNRLRRAWLLDQIFDMADSLDVYIDLVLFNCADYNDWQTDGWDHNPYNAARGGPLQTPAQFVTDPEGRALTQRKLNYVVNRWGYSPHLLAWEWWNEVNLAPFSDEALSAWLQEMTAYLRARDVNRHLTTNSYAIRDLSPIWSLPELDIIQKHEYSDQTGAPDRDLAERAAGDFERLAGSAPPKPILLGEFGYGGEDRGGFIETSGIHLHNGLWSTTFVGYAGSGMYWFWDIYVESHRLWYHFRGLDRFLEDVDLSGYEPFSPLNISGSRTAEGDAVGLGMRGKDVLVWLRSRAYTVQAVEEARLRAGSPLTFVYNPPLIEGLTLTLHDVTDGAYSIQWYDPQTGHWLEPASATAQDGLLAVPIPATRRDLAARIVRQP